MGSEALKPFTSFRALVSFFAIWAIPVFAAAALYVVAAEDVLKRWRPGVAFVDAATAYGVPPGWLFVLVSSALALVTGLNATPVYKLYEGIHWPKRLRRIREQVHSANRKRLADAVNAVIDEEHASEGEEASPRRIGKPFGMLKTLEEYPDLSFAPRPTKLGNRLRAMETYSNARFGLDLITFWYDLLAAVNDEIRRNVEDARHAVEIYVAGAFVGIGLALLSFATALGGFFLGGSIFPLLLLGIFSGCVSWLAYERSVVEVNEWSLAVRALVHTGRHGVAKSFGVALPSEFGSEKHMWEVLNGYLSYGNSAYQEELDYYRRLSREQASDRQSGATVTDANAPLD